MRRDKPENLSYSRKLGFMRVVETKLVPLAKWYILKYLLCNSNEEDADIQSEVAKLIYYLTLPPEIELEPQYKSEVIIYQRKYLACIIDKVYININIFFLFYFFE